MLYCPFSMLKVILMEFVMFEMVKAITPDYTIILSRFIHDLLFFTSILSVIWVLCLYFRYLTIKGPCWKKGSSLDAKQ